MATIAHKDLTGAALHEPKGVAAANSGEVYVADGAGSGAWSTPASKIGVYVYEDVTTGSSPIALTSADTFYGLTNDGAGAGSNVGNALGSVPNVWDTSADEFILTGLKIGDVLQIAINVDFITSGANHAVSLQATVAVGGTSYTIPIIVEKNYKASGTYTEQVNLLLPILTSNELSNTVTLQAASDATGDTITVNSFKVIATSI